MINSQCAALLIITAGCANFDPRWRVADERLRGPAINAAYEWCAASKGEFCPELSDEGDAEIAASPNAECGRYIEHASFGARLARIEINIDAMQSGECGPPESWFGTASAYIANGLGTGAGAEATLPGAAGVLSNPPAPHVTGADVAEVGGWQ